MHVRGYSIVEWDCPKPLKYTREVFRERSRASTHHITRSGRITGVYAKPRYKFVRTRFESFALPHPAHGPAFMAAYYIALRCQEPVALNDPQPALAARIAVRAQVLFDSHEFKRMKVVTRRRYEHLLDDFCKRIGGIGYRENISAVNIARSLRIHPNLGRAERAMRQLPELLRLALALPRHRCPYVPPKRALSRREMRERRRAVKQLTHLDYRASPKGVIARWAEEKLLGLHRHHVSPFRRPTGLRTCRER